MIKEGDTSSEEEREAAESFVAPEADQAPNRDQEADEQQQELNNQLFAKAKESFWLEKHGLLQPPLVNRIREASAAWLKKGGQRLLTFFGAAATLASMAYLEKDQIIESVDSVMKSPAVTATLERSWNQPFLIDIHHRVSDTGVKLEVTNRDGVFSRRYERFDSQIHAEADKKTRAKLVEQQNELVDRFNYDADGTVNLGETKIIMKELAALDFKENDRRFLKDSGTKIELTDPYLRNLTVGPSSYLQPPLNPRRFSTFIKEQTDEHFNSYKSLYSQKSFGNGGVKEFLDLANSIVEENLTYDEQTAAWLGPGESGQTKLKWGGNNPFTAFLSSDNTAVDQLLMDKKVGVCRHFAEALPMVCEEIKRQYPDKFQNIYVVPLADAYQMHEYDAIYVVRGPHETQMFVYDPTNGQEKGSPSFDLFRTLYHRQIIDRSLFVKLSGEYFEHGGTESWEDAAEYLTWAFGDCSPESIRASKPILRRYVNRVIELFHASGTPERQKEIWATFGEQLWPFIHQYELRTGETLYQANTRGEPISE